MSDPTLREALDAGMRALRGWHMAWSDGMRGHDHPVEACPLPMFKDVLAALSTTPAHAGKPAMTGEDLTTPRPWRRAARGDRGQFVNAVGQIVYVDDLTPETNADAALIVEAVNNYDRLRAIEEAARTAFGLIQGEAPLLEHYRREIERVLRTALKGDTHD